MSFCDLLNDKAFKVVFLGDSGTGKTCLIEALLGRGFDSFEKTPTIGVDFYVVPLRPRVSIHLWDTAGQERFRSLLGSYLRDASLVVVTFSVESLTSFYSLEKHWVRFIRRNIGDRDVPVLVVATKCDRRQDPAFMELLPECYIRTSAKTGENVTVLLEAIKDRLWTDVDLGCGGDHDDDKDDMVDLNSPSQSRRECNKNGCEC
jgi:small GTP-binding protein